MPETLKHLNYGEILLFVPFALGAIATALMMVLHPNPMRAALFLVLNLFCVAVLYLALQAWFLAAIQVLVYAGAIMVLFLFVIMLLNLGTPDRSPDRLPFQPPLAVAAGLLLAVVFGWTVLAGVHVPHIEYSPLEIKAQEAMGTVDGVGRVLYNPEQPWLFPFEMTSILLLIAVIGAVVLARRRAVPHGE